jgi:putative flippase GtrA
VRELKKQVVGPILDKIWEKIENNSLYRRLCQNRILGKLLARETVLYIFFGGLTTVVSILTYALAMRLFENRGWLSEDFAFAVKALEKYPWLKYVPNLSDSLRIFVINIISWFCAVVFAFVTNKIYVFQSKTERVGEVAKELAAFFGSRIFSLAAETVTIIFWVSLLGGSEIIAKALIGQIVVLVLNYLLSKFFVFKKK